MSGSTCSLAPNAMGLTWLSARTATAGRDRTATRALLAAMCCFFTTSFSLAHVAFTAPPDETELVVGETVLLKWTDTISHDTLSYHLELRPSGESDPFIISTDLPPTEQSYEWTVPDAECTDCYLLVTQENAGADYYGDLTITIVDEASSGGMAGAGGAPTGNGATGSVPQTGGSEGALTGGHGGMLPGTGGTGTGGNGTMPTGTGSAMSGGGGDTTTEPMGGCVIFPRRGAPPLPGPTPFSLLAAALVLRRWRSRACSP